MDPDSARPRGLANLRDRVPNQKTKGGERTHHSGALRTNHLPAAAAAFRYNAHIERRGPIDALLTPRVSGYRHERGRLRQGRAMRLSRRRVLQAGLTLGGLAATSRLTAASAALRAQTRCLVGDLNIEIRRLLDAPIIYPDLDGGIGTNIQGPSLIEVPDWVPRPLGRYYLYFADHKGSYIRLAFADELDGPWSIHPPGALDLDRSHFLATPAPVSDEERARLEAAPSRGEGVPSALFTATQPHLASPDVHVRRDRRQIVMYYHGLEGLSLQRTRVATSPDGLRFTARPELLGRSYFRAFPYRGYWYALSMPGVIYRSRDGLSGFEEGPTLFEPTMRHAAVLRRRNRLFVFWSNVGDNPERILLSTIELSDDWRNWTAEGQREVLRPEWAWEGAELPRDPSVRDAINIRVNQVRDPAIYVENDRVYLLYSVAGEAGIGIAELTLRC